MKVQKINMYFRKTLCQIWAITPFKYFTIIHHFCQAHQTIYFSFLILESVCSSWFPFFHIRTIWSTRIPRPIIFLFRFRLRVPLTLRLTSIIQQIVFYIFIRLHKFIETESEVNFQLLININCNTLVFSCQQLINLHKHDFESSIKKNYSMLQSFSINTLNIWTFRCRQRCNLIFF